MAKSSQPEGKALIVTGISPVTRPQLGEMGMLYESLDLILSLAGKDTFRASIPTLGAAAVGTYLAQSGVDVKIADYYFDNTGFSDTDIVGISSTFMDMADIIRIAGRVKEQNPAAIVVLGGPLSWSIPPDKVLSLIPGLDYIVQREGEATFRELVQVLRNGGEPDSVKGIIFQHGGGMVETPPRPPLDLEELPQPDWRLMGIPSPQRMPVLPVETSRGCPFHCAYCSEVTYWGKPVRYRSIDRVIAEIRRNAGEIGITTFRFADSCFSAPSARCGRLCDAIYERCIKDGIPVKWSSYARIENLSPTLLGKMKRSGCVALDIGLESGSTEVLRRMGRNYTPEAVVRVARNAREAGIITNFNLVVGFPGETAETVQATAEVIERAAPDTFTSFVFFLAPNTKAYTFPQDYRVVGEGLSWWHDTMTSEEAHEAMANIARQVTQSTSFPAGEHIACYLTALGYTEKEIREFYRAIGRLAREPRDAEALALATRISRDLGRHG